MAVTLGDLAKAIGAELHGDGGCKVERVATLDKAGRGDVSFFYNRGYHKFLKVTGASAVILAEQYRIDCPVSALVTDDPYLAYAKAATLLHPGPFVTPGIHPSASIHPDAHIDDSVAVGPLAVVEAGASIAAHVQIGPQCLVGVGVILGEHTRLVAGVSVCHNVSLGKRCIIHPGAVLGSDGFGLARDNDSWVKIPQIGSLEIGDDVEIGANTTVDRGAIKNTIIENGVKIDNLVQVGHNVRIGAHTAIAGCAGISGSVIIGKRCMIGGGVGLAGHLEIADDVTITGMSLVTKSIKTAGVYSGGWPAEQAARWRRGVARFRRARG